MTLPRARLCFEDTNPDCPNAAAHTPSPVDYGGYFAWARRKAKTHVQRRCPACDLFLIWVPKVPCASCGRLIAPKTDGTPRAHHCTPQEGIVAEAND